ncbi:hypothetical protein SO802_014333 [Lithocarpus litseifolius]|uniref:Protein kinase domain-containing protein n=1 Tax=Lithocarpus litseifolius TaxID=425828 RepID=A0AAW2CR48_9ROSI
MRWSWFTDQFFNKRKQREERAFYENGSLLLEKLIASRNAKPIPIPNFSPQQLLLATNNYSSEHLTGDRIYVSRVTELQQQPMVWERRLKIARQIAHALSYLHTAFPRPVIHMTIHMRHILLDEHDVPKLSDFYASVSIPEGEADVEGFEVYRYLGFSAPEFKATGKVTEKADVYDFGRFLLELLTGENSYNITRLTIDEDSTLLAYIHNRAQGSCINEIVDPAIFAEDGEGGVSLLRQLQAVLDLASTCTEEDPQRRPTMVDVTKQLRRIERFVPSLIIYSLDFIQSYVIDKQNHIIAYPNVLGMTTNKIYLIFKQMAMDGI